ncbi:MAG: hypothetical protein ABIH63_00465 [archaeon]
MKNNGLNYFLAATYLSECSFSNYTHFLNRFSKEFDGLVNSKEVQKKLNSLISKLSKNNGKIGQVKAQNLLYVQDLIKIKENLEQLDFKSDVQKLIDDDYKKIKDLVIKNKLSKKFPEYFIVENFPTPFENMEWTAAFFEEPEEKLYGIKKGVYLKRKYVKPFLSSFILAHELVHILIGYNSPGKYKGGISRGLEDGICDLYGSMYLISRIMDPKIAKNIMLYSYYSYNKEQRFSDLYMENLRQAMVIYKHYGLQGITDLIRNGRKKILEIERLCLQGKYDQMQLKKGQWDRTLDELVNSLIAKPKNLVVSPLAYYLTGFNLANKDVDVIIKSLNLDKEEAQKSLKELQEKVFLLIVNKGRIDADSSKLYLETGALRYEN